MAGLLDNRLYTNYTPLVGTTKVAGKYAAGGPLAFLTDKQVNRISVLYQDDLHLQEERLHTI